MTENKIYIAFLWHMHQPYYKDLATGKYEMPWVRLHGTKDYHYMAELLDEFPRIKQTFNLVPSLMSQLEDYAENSATDTLLDLTLKKAAELDDEDKAFILWNFFMANWDHMIKGYPRYFDLLARRGFYVSYKELPRVAKNFTVQDFLDIQVLFNLVWFDPLTMAKDPELKALKEKGSKYQEKDKTIVLAKQKELLGKIIPKYKELMDRGQAEISTTPFYHPILPLVLDTGIARKSMPNLRMDFTFKAPEDAALQVKKAVEFYEKRFGRKPAGMWPAEGSVSEEVIPLFAAEGIKWIATDEEILLNSLGAGANRNNVLYQPYIAVRDGKSVQVVFRNKELADAIGFVYSKWDPESASSDLINKIRHICNATNIKNPLVTIILDGENAWEYYNNNALEFFRSLYGKLSTDREMETTTISGYLEKFPPMETLKTLYPGSWINHDFYIWIGHEEDKKAWDYLNRTRQDFLKFKDEIKEKNPSNFAKMQEELLIAEGSDWCWWYGDDHSTVQDEEFDALYRKHLANIYELAGKDVPPYLLTPIISDAKAVSLQTNPTGFLNPVIDGKISNFYEWANAGVYDILKSGAAIHRSESVTKTLFFGFDLNNFYFRVDFNIPLGAENPGELIGELYVSSNVLFYKLSFDLKAGNTTEWEFAAQSKDKSTWTKLENPPIKLALNKIGEFSLPLELLKVKEGDQIMVSFAITKKENEVEKWPVIGSLSLQVPNKDFESINWQV